MSIIERNLAILSAENKNRSDRRYLAKPFSAQDKRWGVWDQKLVRYLTNFEVESLSTVELRQQWE